MKQISDFFMYLYQDLNRRPSTIDGYRTAVMLLEHGIRDISRVLVLSRNLVYSAHSVEDAIPHVYKMEGHRSFRENSLILSL